MMFPGRRFFRKIFKMRKRSCKMEAVDIEKERSFKMEEVDVEKQRSIKMEDVDIEKERSFKMEAVDIEKERSFKMDEVDIRRESNFERNSVDIPDLPEDCVAVILSFTSPLDVCTSALVSSTFRSASNSDFVWEKFVPADYEDIVDRSFWLPDGIGSTKELYFRLCDEPLLLDDGHKSFILDKKTGKKCFMIGARGLDLAQADRCIWTSHENSRFEEVAEFESVHRPCITGRIDTRTLSPMTTYAVYLVIEFPFSAFGLDPLPVEVSVNFATELGTASGTRMVRLDPESFKWPVLQSPPHPDQFEQWCRKFDHKLSIRGEYLSEREDGWMKVEMGEFYNDGGDNGEVEVSLTRTHGSHWRGGLIVEGIEVRPKGY